MNMKPLETTFIPAPGVGFQTVPHLSVQYPAR